MFDDVDDDDAILHWTRIFNIWTGAEVLPLTTTAVVAFSVRSIKDYSCLLLGMPVIVPQSIQTIRTSKKNIQSNFTTSKSISRIKWLF